MADYRQTYNIWLKRAKDEAVLKSLKSMTDGEKRDAFGKDLEFGTAGLRGIMSAGTDRMNVYTVYRATEGLARYMEDRGMTTCAVTYDSRLNSKLFGELAAGVLARRGITTYITKECMPTPFISYMIRQLDCDVGINVTASHNPSDYNGYKVYDGSGCQLLDEAAKEVTSYINDVDMFEKDLPVFGEYLGKNVFYVDDELEQRYIDRVLQESLCSAEGLSVVYTPLNGAGYRIVPEALKRLGVAEINVVAEQSMPDGHFATCPYPNPEKREALNLAVKLAEEKNADIVIANDPDSDRLGVAVKAGGQYVQLTGNEVGVLLCDYVLAKLSAQGKLPEKPVIVKTIVTTIMVDDVANKYGAEVKNVLTGFKYIGDAVNKLEKHGEADRFVFGFEESCGYLKGSYVRDKDGVVGAVLIAECAAFYKKQGKTLFDRLSELYDETGHYYLDTVSYRFDGAKGEKIKNELLSELRRKPFAQLGGSEVVNVCDYLTQTETDLPKSNVLRFNSKDGSQLIVRPSGTEPLIKCYVAIKGEEDGNARREAIRRQIDDCFLRKG
ncbi:MAG: phospho-sugar mutase [Firmicutes bacterium]|nr:phospho-sugar mutase [Bacillota bacterium]